MFFNLPLVLQLYILRYFIPFEDKCTLMYIPSFYDLLQDKYAWLQPLTMSLNRAYRIHVRLIGKIKNGIYCSEYENIIFKVSSYFKSSKLVIAEYRNLKPVYVSRDTLTKTCSVREFYMYAYRFQMINRLCNSKEIYQTWNNTMIIFHETERILQLSPDQCFTMHICCYNRIYRSENSQVYLHKMPSELLIFILEQPFYSFDICFYLFCAHGMGNEEFRYRFPALGRYIRILRAYSWTQEFKLVNRVVLEYQYRKDQYCLKYNNILNAPRWNDWGNLNIFQF